MTGDKRFLDGDAEQELFNQNLNRSFERNYGLDCTVAGHYIATKQGHFHHLFRVDSHCYRIPALQTGDYRVSVLIFFLMPGRITSEDAKSLIPPGT